MESVDRARVDVGEGRDREGQAIRNREDVVGAGDVDIGEAGAHPSAAGDETALGAEICCSAAACRTPAAAGELHRLDRDWLAHVEAFDAVAERDHHAGELVAGPPRPGRRAGRWCPRVVTAVAVEVGAADAGSAHCYRHLAGPRTGLRPIFDPDVGAPVKNRRLHVPPISCTRGGALQQLGPRPAVSATSRYWRHQPQAADYRHLGKYLSSTGYGELCPGYAPTAESRTAAHPNCVRCARTNANGCRSPGSGG